RMKKSSRNPKPLISGILPFTKTPGLTSFSSLWSIKHALNTDKVGHTGTLDSFAEGLLVVLTGSLTHLVPHITAFTKTYQAVVCFGKETDTLDPTGNLIKEAGAVDLESLERVLPSFKGALLQVPPVYSAIHVNGKRASNSAREGQDVRLESRQIFIYDISLLDFKAADENDSSSYALLEINCSKGTYIRALARDIATKLGSCAYLCALRRTKVGPFNLEDAACYSSLKPFTIQYGRENAEFFSRKKAEEGQKREKKTVTDSDTTVADIQSHLMTFTPEIASLCGFRSDKLKPEFESSYLNGRPLKPKMFSWIFNPDQEERPPFFNEREIAVFYPDSSFAGMMVQEDFKLSYGFVVPKEKAGKKMRLFTWKQITDGAFPLEWIKRGSAISVGSFDGFHRGHQRLIDEVLSAKDLVPGIVTFTSSYRASEEGYQGDIITSRQKIDYLENKNLSFAILIDFSPEFSRIEGNAFIEILCSKCGLSLLAEGNDFRCGYKGTMDVGQLKALSESEGFSFHAVDDAIVEGSRASSSRVREAILASDFTAVQKLLLR
ncbi:MAG: tRNA pseudouridine(55) synthase TruB, partial [Treponema sp.]|nr:tRNA pseudouridine(55) synthase TruB [Treponema sp.]